MEKSTINDLQELAILRFLVDPQGPDGEQTPVESLANAREALGAGTWECILAAADRVNGARAARGAKIVELEAAARDGMETRNNLRAKIVELEAAARDGMETRNNLRAEISELKGQLGVLGVQEARLEADIAREGQHDAVTLEALVDRATLEAARGLVADLEAQLDTARREAADANLVAAGAAPFVADLEAKLLSARQECDEQRLAVRGLAAELEAANKDRRANRDAWQAAVAKHDEARAEIDRLRAELAEVMRVSDEEADRIRERAVQAEKGRDEALASVERAMDKARQSAVEREANTWSDLVKEREAHARTKAEIEAAWAAYPLANEARAHGVVTLAGSTLAEVVAGLLKSRDEARGQLDPMREALESVSVERERLLGELAAALRPDGWECSLEDVDLEVVARNAYSATGNDRTAALRVRDAVLANMMPKKASP